VTAARPRRALVVAYDFPPHAAIGTMRTLRVVQRLVEEQWDVTVLTSDPRTFRPGTPVDEALMSRVPPSVRVVRAGAIRGFEALKGIVRKGNGASGVKTGTASAPAATRKAGRSLAGRAIDLADATLAIPDSESAWLLPAVTRAIAACRRARPDVMYSSAPPWTGQIVARELARVLRCPWVADFRDPWSRAPWREGRLDFVRRANVALERSVVMRATAVLFVTQGNLADFAAHYGPEISTKFHHVPNGCDPSEFYHLEPTPRDVDRFVLLHAGTLYGARNPLPIIAAIARAIANGRLSPDTFRLRLLGPVNLGIDLEAECRRLGLERVVEFVPRVTRRESLREMLSASALLLVQPGHAVSVPGKFYEYLAAGRPILSLADEGETADLVRGSGLGVSVRPDAGTDAIDAALLSILEMASRPYAPPALSLYDGRVHAAAAVRILGDLARGAKGKSVEDVGLGAAAPVRPLRPEEPGR
jgi:glycosyltransferase involved in cell wall biosynthesis